MRGRVMDRRWLWPIVGVTVFVLACLALGWWQWDRAQSASGTARNLAYALEWPSFAAFAIYMVIKGFGLERAKSAEDAPANLGAATPADARLAADAAPAADAPAGEPDLVSEAAASAPRVPQRRSASPGATPWTARRPAIPEDDPDTDLVSYNRYLAALNAADQQDA